MTKAVRLAALLALTGCVTQGTYDALKSDRDALWAEHEQLKSRHANAETELDARAHQLKDLRAKNEVLEERRQDLEAALAQERHRSEELGQRIAKLEADLATGLKDRSSLQASVAEMRSALQELQKRKEQADARLAEYRNLLAKFKTLIDAGKLSVRIVDGRMVVVLATDVLFASGSAQLSKDGRASLAEVAKLLASIPKRHFQVEGHTDNVPIATAQYPSNWELAAARALTVLKTMVEAGMPAPRISAASYGDSRPAAPNDTTEGRAANRRIEITIVPDLSTLPGFEELNRVERGA